MKTLRKLSQDMSDLYCKTGNKAIESSLISILASIDGLTDETIISWIGTGNISKKISNKDVLGALMALKDVNPVNLENFNKWLVDISNPAYGGSGLSKYLNYFVIFSDVMDDPNVSLVLRPFYPALSKIRENRDILGNITVNSIPVVSDLKTIQDELEREIVGTTRSEIKDKDKDKDKDEDKGEIKSRYDVDRQLTGKETKQERVQNLYDDVYQWLSEDAAEAFSKMGLNDMSDAINKGILGNPYALDDYYKKTGLNEYGAVEISNVSKKIIDSSLINEIAKNINRYIKDPSGHVDFYRYFKEFIFSFIGGVSSDHVNDVRRERSKMRGALPRHMKEFHKTEIDKEPEIEVNHEEWRYGHVIGMISYALYKLHEKFNLD